MRQGREVLRLKFVGGVPTREIARRIGVAASTVRATIRRFPATLIRAECPGSQPRRAEEAGLRALLLHPHDRAAGDPARRHERVAHLLVPGNASLPGR
jgi:transposase